MEAKARITDLMQIAAISTLIAESFYNMQNYAKSIDEEKVVYKLFCDLFGTTDARTVESKRKLEHYIRTYGEYTNKMKNEYRLEFERQQLLKLQEVAANNTNTNNTNNNNDKNRNSNGSPTTVSVSPKSTTTNINGNKNTNIIINNTNTTANNINTNIHIPPL